MGCGFNCLSTCGTPKNTVDGEMVSPFVVISFKSTTTQITVGNESAPDYGNEAVIKSFNFGFSDGISIEVEITDQEGGAFSLFSDHLARYVGNASSDYGMTCQFGWIVANCDGTTSNLSSPTIYSTVTKIEISYDNGKITYKVSATDSMRTVFVTRENSTIGTDYSKVDLQTAIHKIFEENEPEILVSFMSKQGGTLVPWNFKDNPKSSWSPDNQHKLAAVQKWKDHFVTQNERGSTPIWDNTVPDASIIFMEDSISEDCSQSPDCSKSAGTFIVNGGNCSNVISFTPNFDSISAISQFGVGGNSGGGVTGATTQKKTPPSPCDQIQPANAGIGQSIAYSRAALDTYGKNSITKSSLAQDANTKASVAHSPQMFGIKAELKIQGDQRFFSPASMFGSFCSLIVLNPFYIQGGGSSCGDWLAQPACNQVLSNKNWQINGVSHSISAGSFVTTFQLLLASSGTDLVSGLSLGGAGAGNYIPPNAG